MSTSTLGSQTHTGPEPWTPARAYLFVTAIWHLILGAVGLYGDRSFPIGSGAARSTGTTDIFGVFLSNGWHAFLATLLGLIALYFTIKPARAREVALAIGASHVAIVIGLIIWEPSTFWLASNTADQFVHASTAIGGLACGLATRPDRTTARA